MKTSPYRYGPDRVTIFVGMTLKLRDAVRVGACGHSDVEHSSDTENVASVERTGGLDAMQGSVARERLLDRVDLAPAGWRPRPGDDRGFIEHDRRIFNEHAVRKIRIRRERNHVATQPLQALAVSGMLSDGNVQVNPAPIDVRQLTLREARTDLSGDCRQHEAIP